MKTVNYGQGKIYKIVNDITGLCYIGSTIEKYLSNRLSKHKSSYKRYLKGLSKKYCTSFKVLEQEGYRIELIEHYPCQSKYELENRERYWIERLDCVNKVIPTRTRKEYSEQNKDKKKEYMTEWYEQNKDKIQEYKKEWYEQNKDKIQEYKKEYYEQNKEKLSQKYTCECGGRYIYSNITHHLKTKKHNLYIQNQKKKPMPSMANPMYQRAV